MADDTQGQGGFPSFSPTPNMAGPGGAPIAYSPQGIQQAYLAMQREKAAQHPKTPILSWTQVAAGILDTAADQLQLNRMMQQYQGNQAGAAASAVQGVFGDLGGGEDVAPGPAPAPGGGGGGDQAQPGGNVQSYQGDGTPDALTNFVKAREGFSATPYADGKQTSIGYGTRAQPGDTSIDQVEGDRRLQGELGKAAAAVHSFNPNLPTPVAHALTDLTYNAGSKWMGSGLGNAVQQGDWGTAKNLFTQYSHADGKFNQGLYNRRLAMAPMFDLGGQGGGSVPNGASAPSSAMAFSGEPQPTGFPAQVPGSAGAGSTSGQPPAPGGQAPNTSPAASPAGQGGGGFIPPSQQIPKGIARTIQGMIANPNPTIQAQGMKMLQDWQTRLAPQHVERGGMMYSGTDYTGYKPTGIPSKPDIQRMDIETGGVKVPRIGTPEYDSSGRMTGYRTLPITGSPGGQGSPPIAPTGGPTGATAGAPGSQPSSPASPGAAESKDDMAGFIKKTPDQYPNFPGENASPQQLGRYNSQVKEYEGGAEDFRKEYKQVTKEALDARDAKTQLQLLERVLQNPDVQSGFAHKAFANWSDVGRVAGLSKGDTATWNAIAEKLGSRQQVSDIRETNIGQGVAVRATEASAIKASQFSLDRTPEANLAVARLQLKAEDRVIDNGKFANEYAKQHGRLDNGYYQARDEWFANHPFMTDEELGNYQDLTKGAPSPNRETPGGGAGESTTPPSATPAAAAAPPQGPAPAPGSPGAFNETFGAFAPGPGGTVPKGMIPSPQSVVRRPPAGGGPNAAKAMGTTNPIAQALMTGDNPMANPDVAKTFNQANAGGAALGTSPITGMAGARAAPWLIKKGLEGAGFGAGLYPTEKLIEHIIKSLTGG